MCNAGCITTIKKYIFKVMPTMIIDICCGMMTCSFVGVCCFLLRFSEVGNSCINLELYKGLLIKIVPTFQGRNA
jgi:hypothetical protein